MMQTEHAYARTDLGRDYARALVGLAVCAAPFLWVVPATFLIVILAVMAAIFGALLWQTIMRQITRIVVDGDGITMIAVRRRTIPWSLLEKFQLSYFTTWKNMAGFMEMKVSGAGTTMRIGSGLSDFRDVAKAASEAAIRNRLDFKSATIENLRYLNIADPRIDPVVEEDAD